MCPFHLRIAREPEKVTNVYLLLVKTVSLKHQKMFCLMDISCSSVSLKFLEGELCEFGVGVEGLRESH